MGDKEESNKQIINKGKKNEKGNRSNKDSSALYYCGKYWLM